ncbi:MAG: hypothetical protein V4603_05190 [Pseudomonadota bacterium]
MQGAQQQGFLWAVLMLASGATFELHAAELPVPAPSVGDEVVITAQPSLIELRTKISDAEDAMFAAFNEQNADDRYDVHCSWEIRNFSHIKQKQCLPGYALDGQRDEALAMVTGVQTSPPLSFSLKLHNPELAEKIEQAARENPVVMQALIRHYELVQQYDYSRKQAFKGDED